MSDDQQDITKGKGLVDTLFQAPMVDETHIAILSSYEYISQGLREYNLDNKMDRFYIAPAFMDKLVVHITKNFMNLPNIKSKVFAVAFAVLAPNAIILTLNVLLGGYIFFQSLSLLGYCMFPLDVGALIGLLIDNDIVRLVMLAWSSWAAYPFMSVAVNLRRKALALYPVFLMYISVCFLIIAID